MLASGRAFDDADAVALAMADGDAIAWASPIVRARSGLDEHAKLTSVSAAKGAPSKILRMGANLSSSRRATRISGGDSRRCYVESAMVRAGRFVLALAMAAMAASPLVGCMSTCSGDPHASSTSDSAGADDAPDPFVQSRTTTDPASFIYLLTRDEILYAFDPRVAGLDAYQRLMHVDVKQPERPESMAIDRHGDAWVLHRSGAFFRVELRSGVCRPLPVMPLPAGQFGMAFTAVSPGSNDERLYVQRSGAGLSMVDPSSLTVHDLSFGNRGELTGGGDAKLFQFDPQLRSISEVDVSARASHLVRTLTLVPPTFGSFAFARYAGSFFVFTSKRSGIPSQTTVYDPVRQTEVVRDGNIGIEVVGAGQSTLTPTSDGEAPVTGTFPEAAPTVPPAGGTAL